VLWLYGTSKGLVQWQLPQLCDEQLPQECPLAELEKPSLVLQPNVENSFSTRFP
jgi:hypothetical protein